MGALSEYRIEDVFPDHAVAEYNERMDALYRELVDANTSVRVVQEVFAFPDDFLLDDDHRVVLNLIKRNFASNAIVVLSNFFDSAHDSRGNDNLNLKWMKEWIEKTCRAEVREEVRQRLSSLKANSETDELLERARRTRHKLIAHLDLKHALNAEQRRQALLHIDELAQLFEAANELFDGLCVGYARMMHFYTYSPLLVRRSGNDQRSDVVWVLELMAADSAEINMPEKQPGFWPYHARHLTEEQRATFNEWRSRLHMSEVQFPAEVAEDMSGELE